MWCQTVSSGRPGLPVSCASLCHLAIDGIVLLFVSECVLYPTFICDYPWENQPSSHLVMIVEIPVLKILIGVTSFCSHSADYIL